jgi:squalene-hopene/tetraprenyl-beta-curcumene cyclase
VSVVSRRAAARAPSGGTDVLDATLARAVGRLLELQRPGGWWVGELESNVTMTAQHVFLLHFLRRLDDDTLHRLANELLERQRPDGTWPIYWGGEPNLDATIEAYAALRLAGLDADDPRLEPARRFVVGRGGIGAARVFTRIWLALLGLWPWNEVQLVPPEIVLLPPSSPLSVYSFACWARQTMVALSVVTAYRPVRPVPPGRACTELDLGPVARPRTAWDAVDRALARYNERPFSSLRERALAHAERWLLDRQELDGSWGGIQPPWVWSLVALVCRGHAPDSPYLRRGIDGWNRFLVSHGDRLRPEACQSPVWDTAIALLALATAGLGRDEPAIERAVEWLLLEEIRARGDWAVRRPGVEAAGWAFEYDNDLYPDIDDTAVLALALDELDAGRAARERAARWLAAMQSRDGGWGAFDVDNASYWLYKIPFFDFGAVIDPPSADVTAHVVEFLARVPGHERAIARGLDFLLAKQEPDGSWFGRWGVNYVYGTGAALPALEAAGLAPAHPAMRRAVAWLERVQNEDGGFGEDCRSYDVGEPGRAWRGRGASTSSQTAWGLLALAAAGEANSAAARRAIDWLAEAQRPDGDWDEELFTGTGFPRDFLIRYHLYRIVWPVLALARVRRSLGRA